MVKDHSDSERKTGCHHIGYSFRLAAMVCYTSRVALAGTRNSSMGPKPS